LNSLYDVYIENHQIPEENWNLCAKCAKNASKKCSRCKSVWYCSWEC